MQRRFNVMVAILLGLFIAISSGCVSQGRTDLQKANMPNNDVLVWANQAAISVFTYSYANYQEALQNSSTYFTPEGWQNFMIAYHQSNDLSKIIDKKIEVSAVATGAPTLLEEGQFNNAYAWKIQIPVLVNYQGPKNIISQQHLLVTLLITRTPETVNPNGLGIVQFVTQEIKSSTQLPLRLNPV